MIIVKIVNNIPQLTGCCCMCNQLISKYHIKMNSLLFQKFNPTLHTLQI